MNIFFHTLLFISFTIVNAQQFPLNVNGLHLKQIENPHIDPYLHTSLFFNALQSGKKSFYNIEKKEKNAYDSKSTYKTLSTQSIYETNTSTTLFSNVHYHSLDDNEKTKNIIIRSDNIIDCNINQNIGVGDYYVGTSSSINPGVLEYSNYNSTHGFVFSRQVISHSPFFYNTNNCIIVKTKLVHPIQILDTHIQTRVQFPYDRIIIPGNETGRILKGDPLATIDPPMLLCTNDKFTKNTGLVHKSGEDSIKVRGVPINYQYSLDTNGNECLYADATVPGTINFNHASGTNAIRSTIDFGHGIVCNNCYSFIGAIILVDINIFGGKAQSFTFEAKDAGGAGFNIGININNPSFSASKYITLAGPGPVSSIPIAYDLSLDLSFGGAWATIKGSGSSKGQAKFSSGYTLYEEDKVIYDKSRWTATHTLTNSKQLKPTYSESGFKLSSTSLTAIVSVSARIKYSLGGSIPIVNIGASIDFSSVLTATLQYVKGVKETAFFMNFMDESIKSIKSIKSIRQLSDHNMKTYYPSDKIQFKIKYENFNPNEKTELYLTHHHPNEMPSYSSPVSYGTGTPIATYIFKTTSSGSGEFVIDWTVPHDSNLMQRNNDGVYFSIHSSSHIRRYYSNKFHLSQNDKRKQSDIIQYPTDGIFVPVNSPIVIKWDKNKMNYFRHLPGTDGMGSTKLSKNVSLFIISFDKNGHSNAHELVNNIPNNGNYKIKLRSWLRNTGDKFKIAIRDSKEYTKLGWHHGKFQLSPKRQRYELYNNTKLETALFPSPILDTGLPLWGNSSLSKMRISSRNSRELIGPNKCPGAALSVLLQIEFGFDGFNVLGKHVDLGSVCSNPFTIIPQTNICV